MILKEVIDVKIIEGTPTILRNGYSEDFIYIDHLRKKEGSALGFIPQDVYISILENRRVGNRDRWKYSDIILTEDNGDRTGFCYYTYANNDVHIQQIAIQKDARRMQRAVMMLDHVEKEAKRMGKTSITARVAVDLESNLFWSGCGYKIVNTMKSTWLNRGESKSKRPLHYYVKYITSLFDSI